MVSEYDFGIPADEMIVEKKCACAIQECGFVEYVCADCRAGMHNNEWDLRNQLDRELDARIARMFGDRKFERSTAPVAAFPVRKAK
jgi:hypothetical protein